MIGRFGEFWKVREIREFGRLGMSGEWEVRESGDNQYMWRKLRTSWNPGGLGKLGESGDFGDSGGSGDSGNSRNTADSGDSGE